MWDEPDTIGTEGSEGGSIVRDEEYRGACRITLEQCADRYAVYNAMKNDLQAFVEKDTAPEDGFAFCEEFTKRY